MHATQFDFPNLATIDEVHRTSSIPPLYGEGGAKRRVGLGSGRIRRMFCFAKQPPPGAAPPPHKGGIRKSEVVSAHEGEDGERASLAHFAGSLHPSLYGVGQNLFIPPLYGEVAEAPGGVVICLAHRPPPVTSFASLAMCPPSPRRGRDKKRPHSPHSPAPSHLHPPLPPIRTRRGGRPWRWRCGSGPTSPCPRARRTPRRCGWCGSRTRRRTPRRRCGRCPAS